MLVPALLRRGYRVCVLDRLYFGDVPLSGFRDDIDLIVGDVRELPERALDDVDGVIHLAGLSNDPTAEFDPEANWQMNALASEHLGKMCVERGSSGSCSRRRARCTTV